MTNTERFIQALTKDQEEGSGRETLLFDALTEFMKVGLAFSIIIIYHTHIRSKIIIESYGLIDCLND